MTWMLFYAADPKGFFIGLLDGEPISSISAVKYTNNFGFMGLYIVKPGFRGKGYGIQIWEKALQYLGNIPIGLDGVVAQQDNYKKSGFKLAYRNIRFQGKSKRFTKIETTIVPLSQILFDELNTYDSNLFPAPRPQFLKDWISLPESASFGIRKNGKLAGLIVVRKCKVGFKIGPLFADSKEIAEQLFMKGNNFMGPDKPFFLDIPEINPDGIMLAESNNMTKVFETARMYTKNIPDLAVNKMYSITSFELG